jgi:hypothetical protein
MDIYLLKIYNINFKTSMNLNLQRYEAKDFKESK